MKTFTHIIAGVLCALCFTGLTCKKYSVQPNGVPSNPLNLHASLVTPNVVQIAWSNPAAANNVYRLVRNGTVLFDSLAVPKSDTSFIYQDSGGVAPGTQYTYKLYRVLSNDSGSLTVTTLPVSRDNYNFTKTNIGLGGSIIYSIWGANPQSIWLVGGFDTLAKTRTPNVLHIQNGVMTYYQLGGGESFIFYSVYGLNDSDIYFAGEKVLWHWNGTTFDYSVEFYNDSATTQVDNITALWVSPTDDIYCGCDNNVIVHRKNGVWAQDPVMLPPGYTWGFTSIVSFGGTDMFATGVDNLGDEGIVVQNSPTGWSTIYQSSIGDSANAIGTITGICGQSDDSLVIVGNGVFHRIGSPVWQIWNPQNEQLAYMLDTKSLAFDNTWICGEYGLIMHWDGLQWVMFYNYFNLGGMLAFNHILLFPNDVFIVGDDNNGGYLVHGY